MEQLMQYLVEFSPAITAVVGIIVALITGMRKLKDHSGKVLKEVQESQAKIVEINKQMVEENVKLRQENEELRTALAKILAKLEHVHFIDNK